MLKGVELKNHNSIEPPVFIPSLFLKSICVNLGLSAVSLSISSFCQVRRYEIVD
jgi:hypothetical protein